jgi:hypothetical protein
MSTAQLKIVDFTEVVKVVHFSGSAAASAQAAIGVLSKLHHVAGPITVQACLDPHAEDATKIQQQCQSLVSSSPLFNGSVTAQIVVDSESGATSSERYAALLLSGELSPLRAVLHAIVETIWGVADPYGICIMCADIPAARVAGLIGKGGINAKQLRTLGADFDVPRERPQIGNCTIQFSMPAANREVVTSAVQGFVGGDITVVWHSAWVPSAVTGSSATNSSPLVPPSAVEDPATATAGLQDACSAAIGELIQRMASSARPSAEELGGALQEHAEGVTARTLGRLQRGIFACYQQAFGMALITAAHGQETSAAGDLHWMQTCLEAVQKQSLATMELALPASTVTQTGGNNGVTLTTECLFFPSPDSHARLLQVLRRAHTSLDVAVFSITDNDIADTLVAATQRGVAVRVISDDEQVKQQGSDVLRLHAAGMAVKVDKSPQFHMHHKFVVIDGAVVATGSYNWTQQAHTGNHENMLLLEDASAVRQYQDSFDKMWGDFEAPRG